MARTCLVGPRLSVSNPRLLIGWQTHAINGQPAPLLLFGGVHARVLREVGSHDTLFVSWALRSSAIQFCQMNIIDLHWAKFDFFLVQPEVIVA